MKEYNCNFCLEEFDSKEFLENHQLNDNYCIRYKNIEFNCTNCNFRTIGIKNIENHISLCSKNELPDNLINYNNNLNNFLNRIEDKIDKLLKLKNDLENDKIKKVKKIKNKITDEYFNEDNHEYTIEDENIPLKIGKFSPEKVTKSPEKVTKRSPEKVTKRSPEKVTKRSPEKLTKRSPEKSSPELQLKRKPYYKTFKNSIDLVQELTIEEKDEKIRIIAEKILELKKNLIDIEKYKKNIETYIDNIKQNRNYSKFLDLIKTTRTNMISSANHNDYYDFLQKNISQLEIIFRKKEYNDKKIITTITKSMNSIDLRILHYGNYFSTELDIDEMQKLNTSLTIFNGFEPKYQPFNFDEFIRKFYNYGSILFTIKENLERYLFNPYGFNNVVYIPLKNSSENDPWSFYILESISKDKRYWKMDCRLEDLSLNIFNNLRAFLIQTFRKIYSDIYHDNHYRKDYNNSNIMELDCEQLLQNIYILINPKDFCLFIRNLVIKISTYHPTDNDKGDFLSDDRIQKKRFMENNEKYDVFDIIRLLFDGITTEEAIDFYKKD
jgi:hypothetical protein